MKNRWVAGVALGVALAGCGDEAAHVDDLGAGADQAAADLQSADLAAPTVIAQVRANPVMVVGAIVDVIATGAGTVAVDYGPTGAYGQSTAALPVPPSGALSVPIFGLPPSATTHFRVRAQGASESSTADLTLATGALPAGFPTWSVAVNDGAVDGYVMLSFIGTNFATGYAAVIDRAGRLMWYFVPSDGTSITDFQQQPNGDRTVFVISGTPYFAQLDRLGATLRKWRDPLAPIDGHDFALLPNSHALTIAAGSHYYDTTSIIDGGTTMQPLTDTVVDELNPDGGAAFHWSSFGHIGADETTPDIDLRSPNADAQHVNAVSLTLDGNILLSLRHTDTVYKIDRQTGDILWRLGGSRSDFQFVDDPLGRFSHQHFARQLPNGDVLLLDNGNLHTPPVSRAVEYRLDEQAGTARLVWQAKHSPAVFTFCCGSAEREPNGDTMVDWAATSTGAIVDEMDPFSTVRWELSSPTLIYRALRLNAL